jgi:hypothetical protein
VTEIIRIIGTREQKITAATKIKAEFESVFPELADLRKQLIECDMAADNLSSVSRVITEKIDYRATRDDPDRYRRKHALPPIITEEIRYAIQDRSSQPVVPANTVFDSRGRHRRR